MSAAQPLSLDALRRLIAENDYWNPHSAQHAELQRKVRDGFGRLYPANDDATKEAIDPESLGDRGEFIGQLLQRHDEIWGEYQDLLERYAPIVPEYDEGGRLVKDYAPIPPQVEERKRLLNEELVRLRGLLDSLGALPGIQMDE